MPVYPGALPTIPSLAHNARRAFAMRVLLASPREFVCVVELDWQQSNPAPIRVYCDQGAGFQMGAAAVQGANDDLADSGREDVLRADLEDAWLASLSFREKGAEIEIVSEDDQSVCTGIVHDLGVWRGCPADAGPVHAIETRIG